MLSIGILGGTGPQGRGLARRLALAGHPVTIGSRASDRAAGTAAEIGVGGITGGDNHQAARADLVIVTVPYDGHAALLADLTDELQGKIVVDCVNPLGFDKQGPYALSVADGSAAQEAQRILPNSTVIAAFHHLSAVRLEDPETEIFDEDVLVLGEDRDAVGVVIDLAAAALPGAAGCTPDGSATPVRSRR